MGKGSWATRWRTTVKVLCCFACPGRGRVRCVRGVPLCTHCRGRDEVAHALDARVMVHTRTGSRMLRISARLFRAYVQELAI